jgi:Zn-finger nucleic acid-binding protein
MLSRAFEGVSACLRCEGLWIAPGTLDAAFGDPQWPAGQVLWWRNSIDCPECTFEGKQTLMTARMAHDVLVDQCPEHGLWLDRGELGRLMGTAADELTALRERLAVTARDLEKLVVRRDQRRADLESRRKTDREYRRALEDEHRRRAEVASSEAERVRRAEVAEAAEAAEAERVRRADERSTRTAPAAPPHPTPRTSGAALAELTASAPATPATPASPASPASHDDAARRATDRRQALGTQRAQTSAEAARLEDRLRALRDHIHRLDAELADARERAASLEDELGATRARLAALDAALDAPG